VKYIFIVDVSGSMYGYPLEISKKLLRDLIGKLRRQTFLMCCLFQGFLRHVRGNRCLLLLRISARQLSMIDSQNGRRGTRAASALKKALSMPRTEG